MLRINSLYSIAAALSVAFVFGATTKAFPASEEVCCHQDDVNGEKRDSLMSATECEGYGGQKVADLKCRIVCCKKPEGLNWSYPGRFKQMSLSLCRNHYGGGIAINARCPRHVDTRVCCHQDDVEGKKRDSLMSAAECEGYGGQKVADLKCRVVCCKKPEGLNWSYAGPFKQMSLSLCRDYYGGRAVIDARCR